MNRTIISSAVSMQALQQRLDMIANNIANMNTVGYKRQETSFQDVLTSTLNLHPNMQSAGRATPLGLTVGGGARLNGFRIDLAQGALKQTDRALDLAIEGPALFEVVVPIVDEQGEPVQEGDGQAVEVVWSRGGSFQFSLMQDMPGFKILTTAEGYPVRTVTDDYVVVPGNAEVQIDASGVVTYTNEDGDVMSAGRLKLMRVLRQDLIAPMGDNLYRLSPGVQDQANVLELVNDAVAQQQGIAVRQFALEQSNVDLTSEMTELIMVQRAYQLNARALSAGDTMMNLANQLRR